MKRTLLIYILLIFLLPCFAVAADEGKPLFAVKDENGLWGYIDCKGNLVIPGTFTWAEDFRGEYALACQYPKGFVKSDDFFGHYELPDGRTMPSTGFYGIIGSDGQWAVAPEYEEVYSSDEGANYAGGQDTGVYLFVGKTDNKWKFGFFDIPSGYFSGLIYDYVEMDFESELDPELIGVEMEGKLGYASRKTGEIIIQCKYSPYGTKGFDGEYCLAQLPKSHGDDYILINRKGKEVSLPENCSPQSSFSDGLAIIWDYSDNLYGFIDPDGNVVIEPQYEVAYEFSEGLACVKLIDGQWAMIDVNNNIIMLRPDRADYNLSSQYCSHGLIRCALPDTDTIVYYDREGKEAFSLQIEGLDWITEFRDNGVAFFIVDPAAQEYKDGQDSFGLINDRGEIVTQPVYWNDGYNWEFSDGLFAASEHDTGKSGYLDENGQWAFPPVEGHLEPFREGVGCIYKYPDVIFVDREGNELYRYVQ